MQWMPDFKYFKYKNMKQPTIRTDHCLNWADINVSQRRNHIFKVGGPVPWSRVLLPFYRKKLDRSTQFGAVGYIITLYSSKLPIKLGVRPNFGEVRTPPLPTPQWLRRWCLHLSYSVKFASVFQRHNEMKCLWDKNKNYC